MRAKRIPQILIAICLLATPVAIGGVHGVVAAGVLVAGLMAWAAQLSYGKTEEVVFSIPSLGLWLFAFLCVVQVVPFPEFVQGGLNPVGQEHAAKSLEAAGLSEVLGRQGLGWRPLSIDPGRSAESGLRWLALAVFAAVAANVGFRSRRWRRLLWIAVIAGAIVWTIGLIQQALGLTAFLGFYEATIGIRSASTFVNKNHAAVFYGLISLAAFAVAMQDYRTRPIQAILASFCGIVFLVVMAMQKSDGTFLGYGLGLFFIAGALSLRSGLAQRAVRHLRELQPGQWAVLGGALTFGLVIFVVLLGPQTLRLWFWESSFGEWLFDKGRVRYLMSHAALSGGLDYWRFGAGAGAMELGLSPYLDWSELQAASVPTVENEPGDWFFSFGVLPSLVGCALFASGLYFSGRHLRGFEHQARYIVVFSFALYLFVLAFFHFPFVPLGIGLVFVVLFEGGMSPRRERRRGEKAPAAEAQQWPCHLRLSRRRAWSVWAVVVLAAGMLAYSHFRAYAVDYDEVFAQATIDDEMARRLLSRRPTDHELLTRLALAAREAGEYERAASLAGRAFEVRPTNRQLLFVARSRALAGDEAGAVEAYQMLFGDFASQHSSWVEQFMLRDIPGSVERARALEKAAPQWWPAASRSILARDGLSAAVDFSLALIEARPNQAESFLAVIAAYNHQGYYDLAELWARQLIARQLVPVEGSWPAGYTELVDLLVKMERGEEAWRIWALTAEAGLDDPELAGRILGLAPAPGELARERRPLLEHAHRLYCPAPLEARRRATCWQVEATLLEEAGHFARAQAVYGRINHQLHNPRPLAHFLARQGQCQELERFLLDLKRGRHPQASHHLRAVEGVSRTCRRH